MNPTPPTEPPTLAALAAYTRVEKLVLPWTAKNPNDDVTAIASDLIADLLIWAGGRTGDWTTNPTAVHENIIRTAERHAREESGYAPSSEDQEIVDNTAETWLNALATTTITSQYFNRNETFAQHLSRARNEVAQFESSFPGTRVNFTVDEHTETLLIVVDTPDAETHMLIKDEFFGWNEADTDTTRDIEEKLHDINPNGWDAITDGWDSVTDAAETVRYLWGTHGIDHLATQLTTPNTDRA